MRKFYSALLMSGDKAEDANVLFPFQKCHICLQGENIFSEAAFIYFLGNFSSCVILFCFADNLARGGTESLLPLLSHSLGSQHAFSGASPKLLWIRHRQYYDIGESKQQLKRKWKWEVFSVGCLCEGWRDEGQGVIEVDSAFEIKIKKFRLGAEEK